jgi:hypothetical protein
MSAAIATTENAPNAETMTAGGIIPAPGNQKTEQEEHGTHDHITSRYRIDHTVRRSLLRRRRR